MTSGGTFMIEDEDGLKEHLQVVLTDPDVNEEFITVSVCTRQPRMEAIVVLHEGDHPFISRESVVSYRYARIRQLSNVTTAISNGIARTRERVSDQLLLRIRAGLVDSDFTRNDVRSFFLASGTSYKAG